MLNTMPCHKPAVTDQVLVKNQMNHPADHCRARLLVLETLKRAILLMLPLMVLIIDNHSVAHLLNPPIESIGHCVEALKMVLFGIGMLILASVLRAHGK